MKRYLFLCILVMAVILPPALAGADPLPPTTFVFTGSSEQLSGGSYSFGVDTIQASSDSANPGTYTLSGGQTLIDPSLTTVTVSGSFTNPPPGLNGYSFLSGAFASITSTISSGTGSISGSGTDMINQTFLGIFFPSLDPNTPFTFTLNGSFTGGVGTYTLETTAAPEPATLTLLGSGLLGLVGFGRRKLSKNWKAVA